MPVAPCAHKPHPPTFRQQLRLFDRHHVIIDIVDDQRVVGDAHVEHPFRHSVPQIFAESVLHRALNSLGDHGPKPKGRHERFESFMGPQAGGHEHKPVGSERTLHGHCCGHCPERVRDDDVDLAKSVSSDLDRVRHLEGVRGTPGLDAVGWEVDDHTSVALLCESQGDPAVLPRRPGPSVDQESRSRTIAYLVPVDHRSRRLEGDPPCPRWNLW